MEEKKKIKYNLLTQGLMAAGYTVDDHPDYVVLRDGYGTRKSLDNYHGGFTFERKWIREQTFRTPCGLLCKGQQCQSSLSAMGIDWTFENDMATVCCPYEKQGNEGNEGQVQRNPIEKGKHPWYDIYSRNEYVPKVQHRIGGGAFGCKRHRYNKIRGTEPYFC